MERDNHPVDVPPTAGDGEIMDHLRAWLLQHRHMQAAAPLSEVNAHLASLHPSQHPQCYVAAGLEWTSPATQEMVWETPPHGGCWKEESRFVVRRVTTSAGFSPYVGVKRELRFWEQNGTKSTGWTMIQYQLLQEEGPNRFFIEDEMMFCRVFMQGQGSHVPLPQRKKKKGTQDSPTIFFVPGPPLQGYTTEFFEELEERLLSFNPDDHPIYEDVPDSELICTRNTREYQGNFIIKIRSKDPLGVYKACLCCNRMLRAHPKQHGTNALKRHYEGSCTCTATGVECSWTPPAHLA